jgi:hypothetical protein
MRHVLTSRAASGFVNGTTQLFSGERSRLGCCSARLAQNTSAYEKLTGVCIGRLCEPRGAAHCARGGRAPLSTVRLRLNRSAFPITIRSENPIAAAQRIGLMKPIAASGIPMQL